MAITLQNLLNFSDDDLKRAKIKFNQPNDEDEDPMELYKSNPDIVNSKWLFWHKKQRYFRVGNIAICFLKLSYDRWLLTTIKEVIKELDVTNGIAYEGYEIKKYSDYFGRAIIKYHKNHQTQGRWLTEILDELEVLEILPSLFDGENFPGYDKVRLSWQQLETIIIRQKRDWIAALESQKAVYLITDMLTGKNYVGSATGENGMLLQRWTNYIYSGHGGNVELLNIPFDYIKKNFQYAILENYNARVSKDIILSRESWWKETLHTRKFGYNKN